MKYPQRPKEHIKNLLIKILRKKHTTAGDCILFVNQSVYDTLEKAGLVIHWEENHPGAIWTHSDVCGLPVVIDQKEKFFSVVSKCEARERINSIMF